MSSTDRQDDRLGMNEPISRRDFLNGALLAGAGVLLHGHASTTPSPADLWDGYGGIGDYRRANGNTWEVMTTAHAIRDGAFERMRGAMDTGEMYDLVSVGGGLSGLAAAAVFQKEKGGRRTGLGNHPVFCGRAERNASSLGRNVVTPHP